MAEDLTEYMHEKGIRVRYMHSDIDTLERIEIIRDLRLGAFDVLVGINLLREGLDIPECALVAILDADKEGFLRSETSLIQTIGRAARNVDGRVILYADQHDRLDGARDRRDRPPPREAGGLQRGQRHHAREHQAQHRRHPRQRLRAGPRHASTPASPGEGALVGHNLTAIIADLEKQHARGRRRSRVRDRRAPARRDQAPARDRARHRRRSAGPQTEVEDKTGGYRGPKKYGSAANMPETRARKPTLDEMGPHNLGGGTGRPLGAMEAGRSKAGKGGTRALRGGRKG